MAIESHEHAGDKRICPTSLFIGGPISGEAFWLPCVVGVNKPFRIERRDSVSAGRARGIPTESRFKRVLEPVQTDLGRRIALRVIVVALLLAAVVAVAVGWPLGSWIAGAGAWAERDREVAGALFVVAYVLSAVLVVPSSILTLAAGYLFGLPLGVALTSIGSVLGAAAAFVVGRFVARDWVARRVARSPRFRALDAVLRHDGFSIMLLARLSPLIPYNLLNYALSITAARFGDYLLATWIGKLPTIVLYVYMGSLAKSVTTLTSGGPPRWVANTLLALGLATTAALTLLITRRATRILRARLADESQPPL